MIYLDNAGTTKPSDKAMKAYVECQSEYFGNPSSLHTAGQLAKEKLEEARNTVATCLGARPMEIYFTSGGSESDNWAINFAASLGAKQGKKHIITSAFEHHAVLHTLEQLEAQGFSVTYLPVYSNGIVKVEDVKKAITDKTCLVTIMHANNEIGTIQPIAEIAKVCKEAGVLMHTDAVQTVGQLPINVKELGVDLLSFSGHKFHGPKGVGGMYCRLGVPLKAFINGGAQERGKRAGTENLPAIVGMAAALQEAVQLMPKTIKHETKLRDKLIKALSKIPHSSLNGDAKNRLPNNFSMCFEGIEGESLLLLLDDKGICASSGSACTSGSLDPSHVLLAIGRVHDVAHGSLRLTLSRYTTEEEVDAAIKAVPPVVEYLRKISPVWDALVKGQRPFIL